MLARVLVRNTLLVTTIINAKYFFFRRTTQLPLITISRFSTQRNEDMTRHVVKPSGEYAHIETQTAITAIQTLLRPESETARQTMIDAIKKEPNIYAPPVLFALSSALLAQNKPDDAAFWFYAGQLRARYDAMRCADESAGDAVSVLNQQFGPPINEYMFAHLDALKALVPKVVEFDRQTPHDYDHRWINLHGMGAFTNEPILSVPKEEWPEIEEKARQNYLIGFQEIVAQIPPSS